MANFEQVDKWLRGGMLAALSAGEQLQRIDAAGQWNDIDSKVIDLSTDPSEYRIKPVDERDEIDLFDVTASDILKKIVIHLGEKIGDRTIRGVAAIALLEDGRSVSVMGGNPDAHWECALAQAVVEKLVPEVMSEAEKYHQGHDSKTSDGRPVSPLGELRAILREIAKNRVQLDADHKVRFHTPNVQGVVEQIINDVKDHLLREGDGRRVRFVDIQEVLRRRAAAGRYDEGKKSDVAGGIS